MCGVFLQEGGLTLLHIACSSSGPDAVEICRLLLDALADPNARAPEDDSYLSHFLVSISRRLLLIYSGRASAPSPLPNTPPTAPPAKQCVLLKLKYDFL